jgi:hypothetical protein
MAQPVTESTTTRPLLVATAPLAPPNGAAIDLCRIDGDTAIVIYDPEQFDKAQVLYLLSHTADRPVIDIDADGVSR